MKTQQQRRHPHGINVSIGVSVIRLDRGEWRVSDVANPDQVLGYIERQQSGRFEVMWMTDPIRWGCAESFDAALVAFGDSARFTGDVFDQRAAVVGRVRSGSRARRSTWLKTSRHPNVA